MECMLSRGICREIAYHSSLDQIRLEMHGTIIILSYTMGNILWSSRCEVIVGGKWDRNGARSGRIVAYGMDIY